MIGFGVPVGAAIPTMKTGSISANPTSANVGTSGRTLLRWTPARRRAP